MAFRSHDRERQTPHDVEKSSGEGDADDDSSVNSDTDFPVPRDVHHRQCSRAIADTYMRIISEHGRRGDNLCFENGLQSCLSSRSHRLQ